LARRTERPYRIALPLDGEQPRPVVVDRVLTRLPAGTYGPLPPTPGAGSR